MAGINRKLGPDDVRGLIRARGVLQGGVRVSALQVDGDIRIARNSIVTEPRSRETRRLLEQAVIIEAQAQGAALIDLSPKEQRSERLGSAFAQGGSSGVPASWRASLRPALQVCSSMVSGNEGEHAGE